MKLLLWEKTKVCTQNNKNKTTENNQKLPIRLPLYGSLENVITEKGKCNKKILNKVKQKDGLYSIKRPRIT
jgi:hypothetical protein